MDKQQQKKSPGFFNFGFGCCGREANDRSNSTVSQRSVQKNVNDERHSSCSNRDWVDLDEVTVAPDVRGGAQVNGNEVTFQFDNNYENYETLEPIDFEYLKNITKEEHEREGSMASGLSRSSKKISKLAGGKESTSSRNVSPHNSTKKGAKKGKRNPWQPHEDARLLELVNKHGQSWSVLATLMEGRTGKQIRDRYLNILRPNIKKGDWTPQEDQHILALYYQFGHKWSKISSFVPGRTEGQVKNRFYAHIKKKILGNEGVAVNQASTENLSPSSRQQMEFGSKNHLIIETFSPDPAKQPMYDFKPLETPTTNVEYSLSHTTTPSMSLTVTKLADLPLPTQLRDPANMISYDEDKEPVNRHGSNEKFFFEIPPPSPNSQQSTVTGLTNAGAGIRKETDIDQALNSIANFFERKSSQTEIAMQEGIPMEILNSMQDSFATGKMERVDQLQKRMQILEFLLQKTKYEMVNYTREEGSQIPEQ